MDNGTPRRLLEGTVTEAVQHARRKASLLRRVDSSLYVTALEVSSIHHRSDITAGAVSVSEAGLPITELRNCPCVIAP